MDAASALNALVLIDDADTVLIIGDGIDRACLLTGTHKVYNRAVGTVLRAHTALFAEFRIDVGTELAYGHRAEVAGRQTGLTEAKAAVIRDRVGRQRTLVAGRLNDLNFVLRLQIVQGILAARKPHSVTDNFSLFIDTTSADGRLWPRDDFKHHFLFVLFIQLIVPGETAGLFNHQMPCLDQCLVVVNHSFPPSVTMLSF